MIKLYVDAHPASPSAMKREIIKQLELLFGDKIQTLNIDEDVEMSITATEGEGILTTDRIDTPDCCATIYHRFTTERITAVSPGEPTEVWQVSIDLREPLMFPNSAKLRQKGMTHE